jgi:arylsulfatase A-like enzyme
LELTIKQDECKSIQFLKITAKGEKTVIKKAVIIALRRFALPAALMVVTTSMFSASNPGTSVNSKAKRPNILLIIGDDIGMDVTSDMYPGWIDGLLKQYGPSGHKNPQYEQIKGRPASTPTLNNLAKAGMRFTQAWANPFCSPTRGSILTGLYSAKTGVLDYYDAVSQNHHSFVRDLKEKGGYKTAVFGKWHMAGLGKYTGMMPREAGFDLYYGNLNGGIDTYWKWDYHVQESTDAPNKYRTETLPARSIPGVAESTYAPVVNAADAIKWINEQKSQNPDNPWFCWLAFNLSHITGQQNPNPMIVPPIDTMDEVSIKEMKACGGTFGSANVGNCTDKQLMRAMTNSMDFIISKVLDVVNKDPNTYVIYLGDNGTWMFGAKREFIDNMYITKQDRGKGTAYEAGAHVSMAIRGPRIKANSQSDVAIHCVDLFSTILELAGLDVPKTVPNKTGDGTVAVDSISLSPIIFNGAKTGDKKLRDPIKDFMLTETVNPVKNNMRHAGARNATYKVLCIDNAEMKNCTFYNLLDDPIEEYPLNKPESCDNYKNGKWTSAVPEWNFCRLQEALAKDSFLANPPKKTNARGGGGRAQTKWQPDPAQVMALMD